MRVLMQDLRSLQYCSSGSRQFFERHGLDWAAFLRDGIDAQDLISTGDAMAEAAVEQAKKREAVSDGR